MNSALQTISHTYYLRHYLLEKETEIISILLTNAKKILSDTKIFYSNPEAKTILNQKIKKYERDKIRVIVIGDFNDIRSKELDYSKEEFNRKQALPLLR